MININKIFSSASVIPGIRWNRRIMYNVFLQDSMNRINRFYRTSSKSHLQLTTYLDEIIIGTILGDMSIEKPKPNSNSRLQFKQSIINKVYIEHLYSLFKDYCGSEPKIMSNFDSRPNKNKTYSSIKFQTLSLPCFNKYRELFYNSSTEGVGVKIIPSDLENLLTPISLAY
jgi:hypothetical protein